MQGFLFGEFAGVPDEAMLWWCLGLLGAVGGTCLVAISSAIGQDTKNELDVALKEGDSFSSNSGSP